MTTRSRSTARRIPRLEWLEGRCLLTATGPFGVATPVSGLAGFSNGVTASVLDSTAPSASDLSVAINWGDGSGFVGGSVTPVTGAEAAPGIYDVTGSHTYQTAGTYTIQFITLDQAGISTTFSTTATITQLQVVTDNPYTDPYIPAGAVAGSTANLLPASLSVAETNSDPASAYSVAIDWGDGTSATGGSLLQAIAGETYQPGPETRFLVAGSHDYATTGPYSARITVLDTLTGAWAVGTSLVIVTSPTISLSPSPITAMAGENAAIDSTDNTVNDLSNVPIGRAFETSSGPLSNVSIAIDWGDGSPLVGGTLVAASSNSSPGSQQEISNILAPGGHIYANPGTYTIRVIALDSTLNISATTTTTAIVSPLLVSAPPESVPSYGGPATNPLNIIEAQTISRIAVVTTSNNDPARDYAVAIDWGDGSAPVGGTLSPSIPAQSSVGYGFTVDNSHTYGVSGTYTAKVTVLNTVTGQSAVGLIVVIVNPEEIFGTGDDMTYLGAAGQDLGTVVLGTILDADLAQSRTISINWGDGSAPTPGLVTLSFSPNSPDAVITATGDHTYANPGPYTIQALVTGSIGGLATLTDTAILAAAPTPPSLTSSPLALPTVKPGAAASLKLGTVSALDTSLKAGELTAYVNYGDGSKTVLAQVVKTGAGLFQIVGQHTYKAVGTYVIQVSVNEKNGTATTFDDSVVVAKPV